MKTTAVALLALSALITPGVAPQTPVTKMGETITATATIQAIDHADRTISLRKQDGTEDLVWLPPDVERFNELKVGDKVSVRYSESYVFQIRKPGETPAGLIDPTKVTRGTGANPPATMARQVTTSVEVVAVDSRAPSITVKTVDGRTVTRKVEDRRNLEGVKPRDRIDITYTLAAVVSLEPAR